MARMPGGTAAFITNDGVAEAIPVDLVAGTVDVEIGASVGLNNIANEEIDPATEQKQDASIVILTTIDTAQDLTNTKLTAIDLDTSKIPALGTAAMAASAPVTIATDDTVIGPINSNIVDAGAEGSVNGKLRRLTTDLAAAMTSLANIEATLVGAGAPSVDSYATVAINAAAAADQVLVAAPAAGKQIWVYGCFMMADTGAGTVTFQDDADLALSGVMAVSDEGGWVLNNSGNFAMPSLICTTAKALEVDCATCTIDGILQYAIVDVS